MENVHSHWARAGTGSRKSIKWKMSVVALLGGTILLPILLIGYRYSVREVVLAMILLDVCLYPTLRYFARRETGLPILPALCLSFAAQYSIPIFSQEPGIRLAYGFRQLDGADIEAALILTILGVIVLEAVYYFLISRSIRLLPAVSLPLTQRRAETYCISVFIIFITLPPLVAMMSAEIYQQLSSIINLFQNQVLVGIAVLGWLVYSGQGSRWHKILLFVVVATVALRGFSTTMVEMMILPLAVLFMTRWLYVRRLPVAQLTGIALLFLFLSPVKQDIRRSTAQGLPTAQASAIERAADWTQQASNHWLDTISGRRELSESASYAAERTDMIHSFAHIYSLTPSVLPYQYGATYSYLAVTWIPRLVWPEKPQANAANNYYAVAYEISTEEGIKHSSFGVSLIAEGYMNFGLVGVISIMMFLGGVLATLQNVFAGPSSGAGGQAIFLSSFVCFLNGIGTSAELMFGGLVQNLLCAALLLWLVSRKKSGREANRQLTPAYSSTIPKA
jgi:hypothetical protein